MRYTNRLTEEIEGRNGRCFGVYAAARREAYLGISGLVFTQVFIHLMNHRDAANTCISECRKQQCEVTASWVMCPHTFQTAQALARYSHDGQRIEMGTKHVPRLFGLGDSY